MNNIAWRQKASEVTVPGKDNVDSFWRTSHDEDLCSECPEGMAPLSLFPEAIPGNLKDTLLEDVGKF